ncbi:MAG: preprotein translocase subunit SecE [Luteimonas sp.]
MNSKVEQRRAANAGDTLKYAVAVLLVVAGVFAFYWFDGQWPSVLRVGAVVAGLIAGAVVFLLSGRGRDTVGFLSESRFELRKVVWPTRQEAMRLTWVVIAVVIIMSLILAAFDTVIQWAIRLLLGN